MGEDRLVIMQEFLDRNGWEKGNVSLVAGDASFRKYYRVEKEGSCAIIMDAPPQYEDIRPFVRIAEYLNTMQLHAPAIYAKDEVNGFLLLEDLGDERFTRILAKPENAAREKELYQLAIDALLELHQFPAPEIKPYAESELLREYRLFSEWYAPAVLGDKAAGFQEAYETVIKKCVPLCEWDGSVLVLRDYHADNLMKIEGVEGLASLGLLDFQDALAGSPAYDLVSLLEDARRDVSPELASAMLEYYLAEQTKIKKDRFLENYAALGAQRNLKIIGIFMRLAKRDGKHSYLPFIPRVWGYLERDVMHPSLAPLKALLDEYYPAAVRQQVPLLQKAA